eukprot:TRINITY_DN152_c0_g2_i1.p1 TRINITY_DN152_c0_g2~~TRINITY_DN152_c0_g2_i1.p1  ORF type:complete len:439 (-),score=99.99 TRINITY_DN152_c0_g2_i1:2555-3871(-)
MPFNKTRSEGQEKLFRCTEMAVLPVIAKMEYFGIGFENAKCTEEKEAVKQKLSALEAKAYELAGRQFHLDNYGEVSEVLYNVLQLPRVGIGKDKHSTKEEILDKLSLLHPLPAIVHQHRHLHHILENQMNEFTVYAFPDARYGPTGHRRICATYNQTATPTGRTAAVSPNVQCTVNNSSFKGGTTGSQHVVNIRAAFIAAAGCVLLSADYRQIELRILAHFSRDPLLLLILSGREDVFKAVAAQLFDKTAAAVTEADRTQAKRLCYGVIYGRGATSLACEMRCSRSEAQATLDNFQRKFARVHEFQHTVVSKCKRDGFVTTLRGRRRYIQATQFAGPRPKRKAAERVAFNTVCQGSAADVVKCAMIDIDAELTSRNFDARLVLEMHDELLFEVRRDQLHAVAETVRRHMEHNPDISVPMRAQLRAGDSWGDLQQLDLD